MGRQETKKTVGEEEDYPEEGSCQCLRVGVSGKGEAAPSLQCHALHRFCQVIQSLRKGFIAPVN